jgi:excisionase family DNA binding protein
MAESYYRTGQAAKQLGVSSYHIRRLCEAGEIAAEITNGQQWKIPAAEIARLKKEGVPPVPQELEPEPEPEPADDDEPPEGLYADPSSKGIEAAEEVKIVESRLRKRRLEREAEEAEDWFRDRQRQQTAEEQEARRSAEADAAAERRRQWAHLWLQHALDSLPFGAPRELELEVHAAVEDTLKHLDMAQPPAITKRLVDAAVTKALRPWNRRKEVERAMESAMNRLPWELRCRPEWMGLKQRAWEAAAGAAGRVRADAPYAEIEAAAIHATQPALREYEHAERCQRIVAGIYLFHATTEGQDRAREAARKALAALPVGTSQAQLEAGEGSGAASAEEGRKEARRVDGPRR